MNNPYTGHPLQTYGVEEVRLVGGKGDGMRMLQVRNNTGLAFTIAIDRAADIVRLTVKGDNFGYFAPTGYVAPAYYDKEGCGFLKSFTAGFLTTCGFDNVGGPCDDEGEALPQHGTLGNIPCEHISHWIEKDAIHIRAIIRDAAVFANKLVLERTYICPLNENVIYLQDTITNIGSEEAPICMLYHCNMGYPLLSEEAKVTIPAQKVSAINPHAEGGIETCLTMEKPQRGYEEMCFSHELKGETEVSIYNPAIKKGVSICYNADELPCFTEWKMMGEHDYVLGLEPANCLPIGRKAARERGMLKTLKPDEIQQYTLTFKFIAE